MTTSPAPIADADAPVSASTYINPPGQVVAISGNERVFLCSKTGSGKTYWAMAMLAAQPRLVVVDLKGSDSISAYDWDEPDNDAARRLTHGRAVRVRVRDLETALRFMALAYSAGGCIVYVDEVMMLTTKGGRPPMELENIWTRGRELGVGGWAATQRPVFMPLWLISESEWTVLFRLRLDDDRKRMSESMGKEVLQPINDKHGFFVSRDDWDKPNYYTALSMDLKLKGGSNAIA